MGSEALLVTVMAPPQLSVAVGGVNAVIWHSAVISGSTAASGTGGERSSITIF